MGMQKFILVPILLFTLFSIPGDAISRSADMQAQMYDVIRALAMPDERPGEEAITQRFIMIIPGKPLNAEDYYPGDDYVEAQDDPNWMMDPVELPLKVKENMFRLSDVIPPVEPVGSGEKSESLSERYKQIIGRLQVKGLQSVGMQGGHRSHDSKEGGGNEERDQTAYSKYIQEFMMEQMPGGGKKKELNPANLFKEVAKRLPLKEGKTMVRLTKGLQKYDEAAAYLTEMIPDPGDSDYLITRLGLYTRFQTKYNQKRLEMENKIDEKRKTLGSLDYQLWFQRNYALLQSRVEGAYTDWLVFGQKDMVDLYKAHIDTQSHAVMLEEARDVLQKTGTNSSDSQTVIYPISFEPTDLYRYLGEHEIHSHEGQGLALGDIVTQNELRNVLGELHAKKTMLEQMRDGSPPPGSSELLEWLKENLESAEKEVADKLDGARKKRTDCVRQKKGEDVDGDPCREYRELQKQAVESTKAHSQAQAWCSNAKSLTLTADEAKRELEAIIQKIDEEIQHIEVLLEEASPPIPEIDSGIEFMEDDTDSKWMQFEFDTQKYTKAERFKSDRYKMAARLSANFGIASVSGSMKYSKSTEEFQSAMSKSDIRVTAKLMKVNIKQPWFKTALFKSPYFETMDGTMVSPGYMKEIDFVREVQQGAYLLPEYPTAFLMAKDIMFEFRGMGRTFRSFSMQESLSVRLRIRVGPFSASTKSYGYSRSKHESRTETTADALKVIIPDAQIIGYYTAIVPKFPQS